MVKNVWYIRRGLILFELVVSRKPTQIEYLTSLSTAMSVKFMVNKIHMNIYQFRN